MIIIQTTDIILRLAVAAVLGGMVGLERERKEWVAGLRTHTLVCVGASLAMIVSTYGFNDVLGATGIALDPSRVAAQVISGVGFLGAGTILFLRQEVIRGLTTAAGLWSVAAVGLATGGGMYIAAVSATILILFVLAGIKWIEQKWFSKNETQSLSLIADHTIKVSITEIEEILSKNDIIVKRFSIDKDKLAGRDNFVFILSKFNSRTKILNALEEIKSLAGILKVEL